MRLVRSCDGEGFPRIRGVEKGGWEMSLGRIIFMTFVMFFLAACSEKDNSATTVVNSDADVFKSVASTLSGDDLAFFKQRMPDIAGACHGIEGKWHELTFASVNRVDARPIEPECFKRLRR